MYNTTSYCLFGLVRFGSVRFGSFFLYVFACFPLFLSFVFVFSFFFLFSFRFVSFLCAMHVISVRFFSVPIVFRSFVLFRFASFYSTWLRSCCFRFRVMVGAVVL